MLKHLSLFFQLALLIYTTHASAESHTFFADTQYAVDVIFLHGEQPGPTIMVQGGIQGDESCGYLTAQLLANAKLLKGNLIIVPRANPPSINRHKRAINVDLNRRFDKESSEFYEDSLARLIRYLVGQSQGLIHLHEGSGFYNPVELDSLHGPSRFGQSVIIDTENYKDIPLGKIVSNVLTKLNADIKSSECKFRMFNMDTLSERTTFLEQRKSLSYYALTNVGVPALAIEVSKDLVGPYWNYWKVSHQLQAVVLFLKELGVQLEPLVIQQGLFDNYPAKDMKIFVNGQNVARIIPPIQVPIGKLLKVHGEVSNTSTMIESTAAVFASDRPGFNMLKAHRIPMAPFRSLEIRSDGVILKKATISWNNSHPNPRDTARPGDLIYWLNGDLKASAPGQMITAIQGDQLILEGIKGSTRPEKLNLKGYISNPEQADGQDAGHEIILDPLAFLHKFLDKSSTPEEFHCEVVRETPGAAKDFYPIRLLPQKITSLILAAEDGNTITVSWQPQKDIQLAPGRYQLKDILGNCSAKSIHAFIGLKPIALNQSFEIAANEEIVLRQATTFKELGRMPI